MGIDQNGKATPVPLHASPDFHDGQVLIDAEKKTVTLIDFGQAVSISNTERELAVDLLRIAAKVESPEKSLELLKRSGSVLPLDELKKVLSGRDRMDVFTKLISSLDRAGHKVPISAVHWVLGMNRQIALGEKIGVPIQKQIRNLILVQKMGGGLATYNRGHLLWRDASSKLRCLTDSLKSIVGR